MQKFPFRDDSSTIWPPPPSASNQQNDYEGKYPKVCFSIEGMVIYSLTFMLLSNLIYLPFGLGTLLSATFATELYGFLPGLVFAGIQFICLRSLYRWCHRKHLPLYSCVLLASAIGASIELVLLILVFIFVLPLLLTSIGWSQSNRAGTISFWEQISLLLFFLLSFVNAVVSGSISDLLWLHPSSNTVKERNS